MSEKHYDVIIIGRSLGAMALAALLARRDFSVMVIGQGARPADYVFRDRVLRRRCFMPLAATSPAFKRILSELAQSQVFRRRLVALDPMLSVMLPDRRFELPPDLEWLQREIDREFPEVRRVIDDLYHDLTRINGEADTAFEKDVCWPPETFWERRETNAAASSLPFVREDAHALLGGFPANHPYVDIVVQSAQIASNLMAGSRPLPSFAVGRLHGAWSRGPFGLAAGEDDMISFFQQRVTALGGQVLLSDRVVSINPNGKDSHALVLDGGTAVLGATFVVTDGTGESLAHLAQGKGILRKAQRDWPMVSERTGRFTVSLLVRREGLPDALGAESLVFPRMPGAPPDPQLPVVHLQRCDRMAEQPMPDDDGTVLLVAEVLLPMPGVLAVSETRAVIVSILENHLPFLTPHLLIVDSTHDGLPVWVYDNGKRTTVDRIEARGTARVAEPMSPVLSVEPLGYLGLAGEPLRGPLARSFLTGPSVLPPLGQEGELLAAWGVAKIITGSDNRRVRMRRDMWSRIEFG
ncbi:MAG TPA: phytoene dehydrogenase [Polyangiaceae bacterium]|nr:MAG: hypothetical protein BWY17_03449 [Deltaproteobacteria bacterium ADurb.Bin207]HNS98392.1 phytoene dehydrogenase [Polyangiaceae bacterium]HNZ25416.1 phytoene dehydrogenase [Polyangiaceae bacterium]HOD24989.1 phytoene dehydrogenase [Polyangiaceae bacterium]HOE51307.1 phytoene dehydrogenase [Polyangiaceae bacterium]